MSTARSIARFPYSDATPAEAVKRFFDDRVVVSDPATSADSSAQLLRARVSELASSLVEDRLMMFWNGTPYGYPEEIEFNFKSPGGTTHSRMLVSPVPLVKDLEFRFRGVHVYMPYDMTYVNVGGSDCYALRVSARLVTFAGMVVWQAPAE